MTGRKKKGGRSKIRRSRNPCNVPEKDSGQRKFGKRTVGGTHIIVRRLTQSVYTASTVLRHTPHWLGLRHDLPYNFQCLIKKYTRSFDILLNRPSLTKFGNKDLGPSCRLHYLDFVQLSKQSQTAPGLSTMLFLVRQILTMH